jgi:hypothetical protein
LGDGIKWADVFAATKAAHEKPMTATHDPGHKQVFDPAFLVSSGIGSSASASEPRAVEIERRMPEERQAGIQTVLICSYGPLDFSSTQKTGKLAGRITRPIMGSASAADLKFLHHLPRARLGTSNQEAALES